MDRPSSDIVVEVLELLVLDYLQDRVVLGSLRVVVVLLELRPLSLRLLLLY